LNRKHINEASDEIIKAAEDHSYKVAEKYKDKFPKFRSDNIEYIDEIKNEIKRMKLLLILWESFMFYEKDEIYANTNKLISFVNSVDTDERPMAIPDPPDSIETVRYWARIFMGMQVNVQINHVRPLIKLDIPKSVSNAPMEGYWRAPDLLAAMYTMIYMDMIKGKMVRKCKNETCPNWFEIYGNDDRKLYCNPQCANTQGKRMSRRAKKEVKE
jgi:hypothetical protein